VARPQPLTTCSDCPAPRLGRRKRCDDCQREHDRARLAAWRKAHPGQVRAQQQRSNASRYRRHRQQTIARVVAWQRANREQYNARCRRWRSANPERHAEATRRVRQSNPDVVRERTRRRQALVRQVTVERVDYCAIAERDAWTCHLCGLPVDPALRGRTRWARSFDHVIPITRGGHHVASNIKLAHFGCNSRKGNRLAVAA